jgi:hypothetical protein
LHALPALTSHLASASSSDAREGSAGCARVSGVDAARAAEETGRLAQGDADRTRESVWRKRPCSLWAGPDEPARGSSGSAIDAATPTPSVRGPRPDGVGRDRSGRDASRRPHNARDPSSRATADWRGIAIAV